MRPLSGLRARLAAVICPWQFGWDGHARVPMYPKPRFRGATTLEALLIAPTSLVRRRLEPLTKARDEFADRHLVTYEYVEGYRGKGDYWPEYRNRLCRLIHRALYVEPWRVGWWRSNGPRPLRPIIRGLFPPPPVLTPPVGGDDIPF